jgi:hypothetical protein
LLFGEGTDTKMVKSAKPLSRSAVDEALHGVPSIVAEIVVAMAVVSAVFVLSVGPRHETRLAISAMRHPLSKN